MKTFEQLAGRARDVEWWDRCTDPAEMLKHLEVEGQQLQWNGGKRISNRKLRLFAAACCRRHALAARKGYDWQATTPLPEWTSKASRDEAWTEEQLAAAEWAERMADGYRDSTLATSWNRESRSWLVLQEDAMAARECLTDVPDVVKREEADLLRCIVGNPFAKLPGDEPAAGMLRVCEKCGWRFSEDQARCQKCGSNHVRKWRQRDDWFTPTVVSLSQEIYRTQDYQILPILGDALQDAGCEDPRTLGHCQLECDCPGCLDGRDLDFPGKTETILFRKVEGKTHTNRPTRKGSEPYGFWIECGRCGGTGKVPLVHVRGDWLVDLVLGKS